jgi:SAM-dependent methyltransferase
MLSRAQLLEPVRTFYGVLRELRPATIWKEVQYRTGRVPDAFPFPPPRLIRLVIGSGMISTFIESGKTITQSLASNLSKNGIDIGGFRTILDFGCGCGRLIRHLRFLQDTRLYGTDCNGELVEWCRRHLDFAQFDINALSPPLRYDSGSMDFVYARSVFTHLDERLQMAWMEELRRVLGSGGVFYFTTHGSAATASLSREQRCAFSSGELVVVNPVAQGTNLCTCFHPFAFVREKLVKGFELVDFVPGYKEEHRMQDVYIVRKE